MCDIQYQRVCGKWLASLLGTIAWIIAVPESSADASEPKEIIGKLGFDRGVCVVFGDRQGKLAVELSRNSAFLVYVQLESDTDVAAARQTAEDAGMLGTRIYIEKG